MGLPWTEDADRLLIKRANEGSTHQRIADELFQLHMRPTNEAGPVGDRLYRLSKKKKERATIEMLHKTSPKRLRAEKKKNCISLRVGGSSLGTFSVTQQTLFKVFQICLAEKFRRTMTK
jgi:hypothetical protein